MNRYQLEVAEMDRRHRLMMRGVSFIGAACVIAVALWSAGLPPAELWQRTEQWLAGLHKDADQPVAPAQPAPGMPMAVPATQPVPAAESLEGTDSSLSQTPLQLVLVSATPGRNAREGTAALGPNPRNPQVYAAGALLENGARLIEIYPDHVVLERDGKQERLYIKGKNEGRLSAVEARERSPFGRTAFARPKTPGSDITQVGGQPGSLITRASNADTVSEAVRAHMTYENGELVGFQVYPGTRGSAFGQLGLEPGDVVTFINGQRISKDSQWGTIADALRSGAVVEVTVTRNGQLTYLSLDGSVLALGTAPSSSVDAPLPSKAMEPG